MPERSSDVPPCSLQQVLQARYPDISAAYLAVREFHQWLQSAVPTLRPVALAPLAEFLAAGAFEAETQSLFLYREAAQALAAVLAGPCRRDTGLFAYRALLQVLQAGTGSSRQATAEAVGSLPLEVKGPDPVPQLPDSAAPEALSWDQLLGRLHREIEGNPLAMGRSLVFAAGDNRGVVVVKVAHGAEGRSLLANEVAWMLHFAGHNYTGRRRFDIPIPLGVGQSHLVELTGPNPAAKPAGHADGSTWACVFRVHSDYFCYLNDHRPGRLPEPGGFRRDLARNAWLLGKLAGRGIVHTAPIPLFHNRVQRQRRNDGGLYDWPRGGRLDRWFHSTLYPNLGRSGLRDFEHFASVRAGSNQFYRLIGTHWLSLLLLVGSYFRCIEPGAIGIDADGNPVDCRHRFDAELLQDLLATVFLHYYKGFVGRAYVGALPFESARLAGRMVDEMGRDCHMEEILRVADQQQMSREEFLDFLRERGLSEERARQLERGVEDITIHTGPHLGGFNQRISLPELIEFVTVASALCIGGKYVHQKYGRAAMIESAAMA